MLINNHTGANKCKMKGHSHLEDIFAFCKSFKRVARNLGFHIMLKSADLPDVLYTSLADGINVTNNNLYLYIPNLIPPVDFQLMFNEATQNK